MTWGPWIEHDGGSDLPLDGVFIHAVFSCGFVAFGFGEEIRRLNDPAIDIDSYVMRYRIRHPDALTALREIAANPERELADAQ